jgi:hypothetical protein
MKKSLFLFTMINLVGCNSSTEVPSNVSTSDPEKEAQQVMETIMSTPQGRAEVELIGGKDNALTKFQQENGISERIAEASIKEWVITHRNNFDWDLDEVKAICLRNKSSGIPQKYLPESENR